MNSVVSGYRNSLIIFLVSVVLALTTSCMRTVNLGDPALTPFASMYSVVRSQYGFTPIPKTGPVSIEDKSFHGGYDAMLHFGGNPSWTIAFRWDGKAYRGSVNKKFLRDRECGIVQTVVFTNKSVSCFTKRQRTGHFKDSRLTTSGQMRS